MPELDVYKVVEKQQKAQEQAKIDRDKRFKRDSGILLWGFLGGLTLGVVIDYILHLFGL